MHVHACAWAGRCTCLQSSRAHRVAAPPQSHIPYIGLAISYWKPSDKLGATAYVHVSASMAVSQHVKRARAESVCVSVCVSVRV